MLATPHGESHILDLEKKLLSQKTRCNPELIEKIVSPDFIEFGVSGKTYQYKKGDVFAGIGDTPIDYRIYDFRIRHVDKETILALYSIEIKNPDDASIRRSNRSSVWKKISKKWRIIFHQGTSLPPS